MIELYCSVRCHRMKVSCCGSRDWFMNAYCTNGRSLVGIVECEQRVSCGERERRGWYGNDEMHFFVSPRTHTHDLLCEHIILLCMNMTYFVFIRLHELYYTVHGHNALSCKPRSNRTNSSSSSSSKKVQLDFIFLFAINQVIDVNTYSLAFTTAKIIRRAGIRMPYGNGVWLLQHGL